MNHDCPSFHPCSSVVWNIKALEGQRGSFVWFHSLKEGHQVANKFVNFGLDLDRQLRIFENVPQFLSNAILAHVNFIIILRDF